MKYKVKISNVALICMLCVTVSGAYAASSVRSLGGAGTYSSASSAASANTETTSSVRGGSVRVTPTSGISGTSTTVNAGTTTSGRVATTPRLSIGQYLGGTTSVSGGSSVRPQTPSSGSSSGGGSTDPDFAAELRSDVDQLQRDVENLRIEDENISDALLDKQDILIPTQDGYIIIDDNTNEIFVDVEALKGSLDLVAGEDGREIELGYNDTDLLWRYVGDGNNWNILISKAEITGPQGPKGEKGDPGDSVNLDNYSTTEQMNFAIANAIAAIANTYATKEELAGYATTESVASSITAATSGLATNEELVRGLAAKADADSVYTKEEVYNRQQVDDKVAGIVAGDIGEALTGYVKTDDFNTAMGTKADVTTVNALETEVGEINDLATEAALGAAQAISGLETKADKSELATKENISNKTQTITDSADQYPSSAAVSAALGQKANISDLDAFATTEDLASKADAETVESLSQNITNITQQVEQITDPVTGLEAKIDDAVATADAAKTAAESAQSIATAAQEKADQVDTNLALKENISNKAPTITDENQNSGSLYPSINAVVQWTNDKIESLSDTGLPVNPDNFNDNSIDGSKLVDGTVKQEKLSPEVQQKLDGAVTMNGAGNNVLLGTDENGDMIWHKIAF